MLGRAGRAMESWVAIRALIVALDKDFSGIRVSGDLGLLIKVI